MKWMSDVNSAQLTCFDQFIVTLRNYLDEITNYFIKRYNSGFVEGFNNKLKVLTRRCYGLKSAARLFQRIKLDLDGLELFKFQGAHEKG